MNGNLIFLGFTSEEDNKDKRIFYILNKNGRGYFTGQITNEENAISIFEGLSDSKDYGNLFSFILEDKEYIWAISLNNLIELYDLDAHAKYEFSVNQMLGTYSYTPHISSFLEIDNNYFLGLKGINEGKNTFLLYKLNYSLNDNEITTIATSIPYQSSNSKIVSCYKTVLKYIICFYQNSFKFYYANAYDQNLGFVTYTDIFDES